MNLRTLLMLLVIVIVIMSAPLALDLLLTFFLRIDLLFQGLPFIRWQLVFVKPSYIFSSTNQFLFVGFLVDHEVDDDIDKEQPAQD